MLKDITRKPKKIDNKTFLIAYEGNIDEKEYFETLQNAVPQRFRYIIKFIAIEKTGNDSSPNNILNDLLSYAKNNGYKTTSSDVEAFIVFDKDDNFVGTHKRGTFTTIAECNRRKITPIVSAPSFEIWKILHHIDVSTLSEQDKLKLIENRKKAKGAERYIKRLVRSSDIPNDSKELLSKTKTAIGNEEKLNNVYEHIDIEQPRLQSQIGNIFKVALLLNIPIFDFMGIND